MYLPAKVTIKPELKWRRCSINKSDGEVHAEPIERDYLFISIILLLLLLFLLFFLFIFGGGDFIYLLYQKIRWDNNVKITRIVRKDYSLRKRKYVVLRIVWFKILEGKKSIKLLESCISSFLYFDIQPRWMLLEIKIKRNYKYSENRMSTFS